MRQSTIARLQLPNDDSVFTITSADTQQGTITWLQTPGGVAIVHEWPNERDGFTVYAAVANEVEAVREAMGL